MYQIIKSIVSLTNHLVTPSYGQRRSLTKNGPSLESLEGRNLMSAGMRGPFGAMGDQGNWGHSRGGNGHGHSAYVGHQSQTQAGANATATPTTAATSTSPSTPTDMQSRSDHPRFPGSMPGGLDQGGGGPMMGGFGPGGGGPMMGGGPMGRHRGGAGGGQNGAGGFGMNPNMPTGTSPADIKLRGDFAKLKTDMQTIHDKSQVTPAMMSKVRKDWEAISAANPGLDMHTIGKPADTSSTTPPTTRPTFDQQLTSIQTALTNAKVSQTLIDPLVADLTAVNTASGVTADDLSTIQADHDAIKADSPAPTTPDQGHMPGGHGQGGFHGHDGPGGRGMMRV